MWLHADPAAEGTLQVPALAASSKLAAFNACDSAFKLAISVKPGPAGALRVGRCLVVGSYWRMHAATVTSHRAASVQWQVPQLLATGNYTSAAPQPEPEGPANVHRGTVTPGARDRDAGGSALALGRH